MTNCCKKAHPRSLAFPTDAVASRALGHPDDLPKAVAQFKKKYPSVQLRIHQGNPTQICEQVLAGDADLCVATEAIALYPELVSLPVYQWNRCVVV